METIKINVDCTEGFKEIRRKNAEEYRKNFEIKPKFANGIMYSVVWFKGEETNLIGTIEECQEIIEGYIDSMK